MLLHHPRDVIPDHPGIGALSDEVKHMIQGRQCFFRVCPGINKIGACLVETFEPVPGFGLVDTLEEFGKAAL